MASATGRLPRKSSPTVLYSNAFKYRRPYVQGKWKESRLVPATEARRATRRPEIWLWQRMICLLCIAFYLITYCNAWNALTVSVFMIAFPNAVNKDTVSSEWNRKQSEGLLAALCRHDNTFCRAVCRLKAHRTQHAFLVEAYWVFTF